MTELKQNPTTKLFTVIQSGTIQAQNCPKSIARQIARDLDKKALSETKIGFKSDNRKEW